MVPTLETSLRTGNSRVFTKLDLQSAFWQVPVLPRDREKTAFSFDGRVYVWRVMPFGLMNAPATFQSIMDTHFADISGKFLRIYIDDLLVFSDHFIEHLEHLDRTLGRLEQVGLKASLEKTLWAVCRVPYLGYILTPGRVEMDPDKVRDALKIPTPDRVININNAKPQSLRKLVRIFLGLTGFYRVFI